MLYKYKVWDKQLGVVTGTVEEPSACADLAYIAAMQHAAELGCREVMEAEITTISSEPPQASFNF